MIVASMSLLSAMMLVQARPKPGLDLPKSVRVTAVRHTGFFSDPTGAVGIPYLDRSPSLPVQSWQDLPGMARRATKVKAPMELMRLSLKIELSNGTQLLFDKYSRFVQVSSRVEALTSYKAAVYELRSSDFREVLFKVYSVGQLP